MLGGSLDKSKRAVRDLVAAGWLVKDPGLGRGNNSGYGFVSRGTVVVLKGGKNAPPKGGNSAPFYGQNLDSEKGANLHRKGGKNAPPPYIDKPYKNHKGAGAREAAPKLSENPMVHKAACDMVNAMRRGKLDAWVAAQPWVRDHARAANLFTDQELQAWGLAEKKGD
ncbi:MAG: hypothetical protein AAFY75_04175 [Pseudomonadota bacterium]